MYPKYDGGEDFTRTLTLPLKNERMIEDPWQRRLHDLTASDGRPYD